MPVRLYDIRSNGLGLLGVSLGVCLGVYSAESGANRLTASAPLQMLGWS